MLVGGEGPQFKVTPSYSYLIGMNLPHFHPPTHRTLSSSSK